MAKQEAPETDTGHIFSEYVSEDELAEMLPGKPKPRTLRRWRALGEGPTVTRIGCKVYYHLDDVREWLRSRQVEAA